MPREIVYRLLRTILAPPGTEPEFYFCEVIRMIKQRLMDWSISKIRPEQICSAKNFPPLHAPDPVPDNLIHQPPEIRRIAHDPIRMIIPECVMVRSGGNSALTQSIHNAGAVRRARVHDQPKRVPLETLQEPINATRINCRIIIIRHPWEIGIYIRVRHIDSLSFS
jgi:hypothetical protein